MTAHPATEVELLQDTAEARPVPPVLVLAWQEGRRMVLHPAVLLGLLVGLSAFAAVHDNGPRDAFDAATAAMTFFLGVPTYFAANLVASRDRRAHSDELLAAAPVGEQLRTWALCLGCLVPFAAALALTYLAHTAQLVAGTYDVVPWTSHLVTGPVSVLGGALLGVMVARWFPVPGAAALVMVAMVAWNVYANNRPDTIHPLGTYVAWARWAASPNWAGFLPGSPAWHVAYLLGLSAMAFTGALLPGARSKLPVLFVGAVLTALTAVAGTAQLT